MSSVFGHALAIFIRLDFPNEATRQLVVGTGFLNYQTFDKEHFLGNMRPTGMTPMKGMETTVGALQQREILI